VSNEKIEVKVNFPDNMKGGAYCNQMFVQHTQEEFIMDFISVVAPIGALTARVITSPGHIKRILKALEENIKKYEDQYGLIVLAKEPQAKIGF